MGQARIVLSGLSPRLQGLQWESLGALRIGRHASADIPLNDHSVAHYHAKVFPAGQRWLLRDLASSERRPTLLNGTPVGTGDSELRLHDVIHCGNVALQVTAVQAAPAATPPKPLPP